MINELTELNAKLKSRVEHIFNVIEQYDESTDYEELECINIEVGVMVGCQLMDTSGNMARISVTGKEYFHPPVTKEFNWPIDLIESWDNQQIIDWFKEENERLFDKELKESYRSTLSAIKDNPCLFEELIGVENPEEQLRIIKRHVCKE